jgi:hypothetical protein
MIGWGADLAYMKGLVNALDIFQGIKRSLRRWQTQEFPMKKYSIGTLIYVVWNQLRPVISRFQKLSFLDGALRA